MNVYSIILAACLAAPPLVQPVRVANVISGHIHPALAVTPRGDLLAVYNKQGGGGYKPGVRRLCGNGASAGSLRRTLQIYG